MGTPTKRNWQRMLAVCRSLRNGSTYEAAYRAADVTRTTVWRWKKHWPRFADIIQKLWDDNVCVVEDAHFAAVVRGNIIAQMHILHNRKRERWQKMPDTVVKTGDVNVVQKVEYKQEPMILFVDSKDAIVDNLTQESANRVEQHVGSASP